ncbi:actin-like protein arp8 [Rhizophlyctis rosea]|uniref:Actin-like protein arp8 n=1 Tax=Rhizophlyctis rosea TaxID=64517 RepID=A0AAD5S2V1_9FUNG|nr:actin-like protein arp8 [Rhizophlyctis rosea]
MPAHRHQRQALKFTSIPVIQSYGQAQKNATSTYLKSGTSYLLGSDAEVDIAPDSENNFSDVIVIHVGSRNLRIGRASDAVPRERPQVIARKVKIVNEPPSNPPSTIADDTERSDHMPFWADLNDSPDTVQLVENDIKQRLRSLKIRSVPNARSQIITYNTQSQPEKILDHNDPYKIEWTQPAKGKDYVAGMEALRISELNSSTSHTSQYRLFYPIQHGLLNTRDYTTLRACINDLQTIWTKAIEEELEIPKSQFSNQNVMIVVPDICGTVHIREIANLLMRDMGFKAFVMLQVRINLKYGGDDVTAFFVKLLQRSEFPYKRISITTNVYDWLLAEELKERLCTLNEVDMSVNVNEFTVRSPERPTLMYKVKVYDEPTIAAMTFFYPAIIDFETKLRYILYKETFLDYNADDENDGDNITPAQESEIANIYRNYIRPLPETTETACATSSEPIAGIDIESAPAEAMDLDIEPTPEVEQTPTDRSSTDPTLPTDAASSDATIRNTASTQSATPAPPPIPIPHPMHWLRRRRAMGNLPAISQPLDFAIAQSIIDVAKSSPDARDKDIESRVKNLCSSILLVGGGGMIQGLGKIIEERVTSILQNSALRTRLGGQSDVSNAATTTTLPALTAQVLQSPREIDPRVLVWKGASVFAKLDMTGELWIGRREWEAGGLQRTAGKWLFTWD